MISSLNSAQVGSGKPSMHGRSTDSLVDQPQSGRRLAASPTCGESEEAGSIPDVLNSENNPRTAMSQTPWADSPIHDQIREAGLDTAEDCSATSCSPSVAALFVAESGCYSELPHVDPWPESRDARGYDGSLPVVAHPPCQLWVNMAGVNFKRYGGSHNRPGNDHGCFYFALAAVMRCGGVLEHPASSFAWSTFGLHRPDGPAWVHVEGERRDYWVCEVWQSAYGHKARKKTWLLYCGDNPPEEMRWEREAGTHQVGWFDRTKPTLSKREAIATPPEFRDALIALALKANTENP